MITAARKPSTLGPSPKLRVGHKHALRQFSINLSVPTSSNIYIQRKSICVCGGGCPRCLGVIQSKLAIGQSNDIYEQQADRVADQIVRMSEPIRQPQAEAVEERFQTKPTPGASTALSPNTYAQIQALRGGGQPLSLPQRRFFESRIGHDFGHVRVHTGSRAETAAHAVRAQAFTLGQDIIFAASQYAPHTRHGQRLLAHELVHVVQQGRRQPHMLQRRASRPRTATIPTLTSSRSTTFLKDLNAALRKLFSASYTLTLKDYKFLAPEKYAAYTRGTTHGKKDYGAAKKQAAEICGALTPGALAKLCRNASSSCPRLIRKVQRNRRYCRGVNPTNLLIAGYLQIRGVTPARGTSVLIREYTTNPQLFLIVHEGLHRAAGKYWKPRSSSTRYFARTTPGTPFRLAPIREWLDEGTTQILSQKVIAHMQRIPQRNWFKGYSSTAYQAYVNKVRRFLRITRKSESFLTNAYFTNSNLKDVEDLQSWQSRI